VNSRAPSISGDGGLALLLTRLMVGISGGLLPQPDQAGQRDERQCADCIL
jgi:hypothetical protein